MLILKNSTKAETKVKNSRFLAEIFTVESPEEAKEKWRFKKDTYDNGGHIVYAFTIGPKQNISGCSDDGEPSGTAGRPVLAVLQGSGITNAMITVARWFGGTKLGTGGLVHAYSDAAKEVVAQAACTELVPETSVCFTIPYPLYANCRNHLDAIGFSFTKEEFSDVVMIAGKLRTAYREQLEVFLRELGNGKIVCQFQDL
jgi:uncharacterized YigZ family protein